MASSKRKLISIITPFFNEEEVVDIYFNTIISSIRQLGYDFEFMCIDDGSKDRTSQLIKKWQDKSYNIKLIAFSRNFGKEAALTAGLKHAKGDAVIPIDADLQDPPTLIPAMLQAWEKGYKVVEAKRISREDGFCKTFTAKLFYKTIGFLTNGNIKEEVGDFRLLDRKVVDVINLLPEKTRFMKGVFAWVGFKTKIVEYSRPSRVAGETKQGLVKLIRLALDGIISFTTKPLKIWLYLGIIFSAILLIYAIYLVLRTLIWGVDVPGYTSIMVAVLFTGCLNLLSLGVIGQYVARIYKEVKNRPIYLIDEIYERTKQKPKAKTKVRAKTR